MPINYNDISHIESYLKGEMEAADRQAFETQLAEDAEMRTELKAYQNILQGLDGLGFRKS